MNHSAHDFGTGGVGQPLEFVEVLFGVAFVVGALNGAETRIARSRGGWISIMRVGLHLRCFRPRNITTFETIRP